MASQAARRDNNKKWIAKFLSRTRMAASSIYHEISDVKASTTLPPTFLCCACRFAISHERMLPRRTAKSVSVLSTNKQVNEQASSEVTRHKFALIKYAHFRVVASEM